MNQYTHNNYAYAPDAPIDWAPNDWTPRNWAQLRARFMPVRVQHVRTALLGVFLVFAFGCDDDGGGSDPSPATISNAPIDLPPGQTSAQLEWAPSAGSVSGYLVFESRNTPAVRSSTFVQEPRAEIIGEPGDSVTIQVWAVSEAGNYSAPSPPSVPIRFHAAVEASSAVVANIPNNTPSVISLSDDTPDTTDTPETADAPTDAPDELPTNEEEFANASESGTSDDAPKELEAAGSNTALNPSDRQRLLNADPRFPLTPPSSAVYQWIQSHVDTEIGDGLSLIGTGQPNDPNLREGIWSDQSGQVFVSDNNRLKNLDTEVEEPSDHFIEAIRLGPTERFAGLVDFDGDGIGDWLIEELATQQWWILNGQTEETLFVATGATANQTDDFTSEPQLRAHGDFDGDGKSELLWQAEDGSIGLTSSTAGNPVIEWLDPIDFLSTSTGAASRLLTVADLNADGRDDLLFIDVHDRLVAALSHSLSHSDESDHVVFTGALVSVRSDASETSKPSNPTTVGLELIATLDLDEDGQTEIAWLREDGGGIELWDLSGDF